MAANERVSGGTRASGVSWRSGCGSHSGREKGLSAILDLPAGTITFLFTDIEGSTRLWEEAPETMRPALGRHDSLLRDAVEQQGGHVFKTIGDAFCAAFGSVPEAAAAALTAQRALRREGSPMRVRMAVHAGEAEARGGDYFGPALNRTARLLTAAHGGQVLLSHAAAEALGSTPSGNPGLRSLGRHQLRDFPGWETIYQLQAPDLPAAFPPLNTVDVAERRGRRRAYARSAAIGLVMLALVLTATQLAVRASRLAEERRLALDHVANLLYASRMNLAHVAYKDGKIAAARRLLELYLPRPAEPDRRDFAWRLLWRLCRSDDRYAFPSGASEVVSFDFSPDGSVLAASRDDGHVQLWDMAAKELLATLSAHQGASAATFSPDGKLLATVGWEDGTVKLWELGARPPVLRWERPGFRRVRARALFTPDGATLIAGLGDDSVRLWALGGGRRAPGPDRSIPARATGVMALSPDGRRLALCGAGKEAGRVTLWDIGPRAVTRRPGFLPPIGGLVESIAFSPDGKILATGGAGGIVVWHAAESRVLRVVAGHEGVVLGLAFSPDGKLLASGTVDGAIRLSDPGAGRLLATLQGHMARVTSVRFSPRGDTLASSSGDGTVRLWDTDVGRLRERAGRRRREDTLTDGKDSVGGLAFSPDGRLVAVVRSLSVSLWDPFRQARVDPPLRQEPGAGGERGMFPGACGFSPDGSLLAASGRSGDVNLWRVAARRRLSGFQANAAGISRLGFAAGGTLVTANGGGSTGVAAAIRFWNGAETGRPPRLMATLPGEPSMPQAPLAVSPDRTIVATTSPERLITLWAVPAANSPNGWEGRPRRAALLQGKVLALSLAFSPDGRMIAAGSSLGIIHLWDRATGKQVRQFVGHVGPVLAVAFSSDGKTLATGGMDRTIRLWSPGVDQQEAALTGHRDWVWALAFSPDDTLLASGGPDGTVRLWHAAPASEKGL